MSLINRLNRIERDFAERPCPRCDVGPALFLFDDDPEPMKAEPCAVCGNGRIRMPDGEIVRPWTIMRFTFG